MPEPLEGMTVLDFSWFEQGPLACVHLSDLGARVIKVEPPTGDPVRGSVRQGVGTAYIAHNRGKESITVNLRTEQGQEIVHRLVRRADILVHNFTERTAELLHLTYSELKAVNPQLIYVRGSSFGPGEPRRHKRAMDVAGQAYSGIVSVTGNSDGSPLPAGAAIADAAGALTVVTASLAGLVYRGRFGLGCEMIVSLFGAQMALQSWELTHCGIFGERPKRAGTGHPLMGAWGIFPTQDGHIALAGVGDAKWEAFCDTLGLPDLGRDPALLKNEGRVLRKDELIATIAAKFKTRPSEFWLAALEAADVIAAPVQHYDEILRDEQAWSSGYLQRIVEPELGEITVVAAPYTINGTPASVKGAPPALGQHTELILEELGYTWDQIPQLKEAGCS